jgi:integrase
MKRERNKLTAAAIRAANEPDLYNDGYGLNLQVRRFWSVEYDDGDRRRSKSFDKEDGATRFRTELLSRAIMADEVSSYLTKSWLFRFMINGKGDNMGLGALDTTSLAKARELAQKARDVLRDGVNPRVARDAERRQRKLEAAKQMTFLECASAYVAAHKGSWKNEKHVAQWEATFAETKRGSKVYPAATAILNDLPVQDVDVALVRKALEKIWYSTPETASRVRGRIERVLAWATVAGYRTGDNPARWTGHLKELLPAKSKVAPVAHHGAVPYKDMPSLMVELRAKAGISARALEFTILNASRTGEVIGAKWNEIDVGARVWNVPASRMKSGRPHAVPLADRALSILAELPHDGDYVFMGARKGEPLSNMAMLELLRGMRGKGVTVHGTARSSFRDWAGNETNFARELAEHALAHVIGDKAEQAYRRSDALQKRRKLMDAWAAYCERPPAASDNVVSIGARA